MSDFMPKVLKQKQQEEKRVAKKANELRVITANGAHDRELTGV